MIADFDKIRGSVYKGKRWCRWQHCCFWSVKANNEVFVVVKDTKTDTLMPIIISQNQAKRALSKYLYLDKKNFYLFVKECGLCFNCGTP